MVGVCVMGCGLYRVEQSHHLYLIDDSEGVFSSEAGEGRVGGEGFEV